MSPRRSSRRATAARLSPRKARGSFTRATSKPWTTDAVAIIVAAGRGERLGGDVPKAFIDLAGKSMLRRSAEALAASDAVKALIVVAPEDFLAQARADTAPTGKLRAVVTGGATRQDSVRAGLARTKASDGPVLVHDAARPFVDTDLIARVLEGVRQEDAAIPVAPVVDTIKRVDGGRVGATVNREDLGAAQTPQGFSRDLLLRAYTSAAKARAVVTDEAMLLERHSWPIAAVRGSASNFKITTPDDLARARQLLAPTQKALRVGHGFDVHRLLSRRKLMLGGVHVPSLVGLEGHSDGDVLLHAICDALLGAGGLGEIGSLFPSTDRKLKGAPSSRFVAEVLNRLAAARLSIVNVDATLIAERPRLGMHLEAIRKNVARLLKVEPDQVSIKVKSTDTLGAIGRGEGIAAQALALLARS